MVTAGTLYTYPTPGNFRASKVLIAAEYGKTSINVVSQAPDFILGETNKSPEFLKKFPLGKVPAFQTPDNQYIFESNAIAFYVGSDQLRGKNKIDQAHVVQWLSFADSELLPSMAAWVFPAISIMQFNKSATERAKTDLKRSLQALNDHLQTRTYLVGERITLADIATSTVLVPLYQNVLEPSFRGQFGNVNRWFSTLVNQPEFKAVLGEVKLCDKAAQFDAKKYAEIQGGQGGKGREKKTSESSGKGDSKPKAEKKEKTPKKAEKKEEEEMDEADLIVAREEKSKDPFDKFPPGTFNMDAFKRCYSNNDVEVSIPYFWENFDKEHYSIWYCNYKYTEDLSMVFMTCNLVSGMMQRLDKMRKHAFGSMIIFGEDNNNCISGVWVWRGHDLAFELSSDWQVDYESYDWKKLDPSKESDKTIVNEYFAWDGKFDGKKFNQGKIFK